MYKNAEGYSDETAGQAITNVTKQHKEKINKKEEENKKMLIEFVKDLVELLGFELIDRIHIKSKLTGKEYK